MRKLKLWFLKFYIWLEFIWVEVGKNAWSLGVIFLLYLLLWKFDQAQDLLLSINQHTNLFRIVLAVPLFFTSLFVLAFLIWNIPIFLAEQNFKTLNFKNLITSTLSFHDRMRVVEAGKRLSNREKLQQHIKQHFSAVLGIILMGIAAFAIVNSMIDFRIIMLSKLWLNIGFGMFCLYFILLLNPEFYRWNAKFFLRKWNKLVVFYFWFPFLLLLMIGLGFANYNTHSQPLKMTFLFISQISNTLLFAMLVFGRKYIGFEKWKSFLFMALSIGIWIFFLLFIILNAVIVINPFINPLVIFVAALIFYLVIIYSFKWIGKKKRVPFFTIFLILIVILSVRSQQQKQFDHYAIPVEDYSNKDRLNLKTYVKNWIDQRETKIQSSDNYPVYLVSSQGGGSKGGLWSGLVLGYINENSQGQFFDDHLISLTGASGGSVGNGLFFAEASQPRDSTEFWEYQSTDHLKTKIGEFYKNNYLSTSVSGLLGRDFWQSVIGFSLTKNRGEILADEWERNFSRVYNNKNQLLKQDFLSFYKEKQDNLPLLVINTTHIQSGRYCYISPVSFETKAYLDFYEILDSCRCENKSIKLSTALALNASFPLIGSVGDIRGCSETENLRGGQLADAGYYDNIGGTITQFIYDELEIQLQQRGLISKVNLVNLILVNDTYNYEINPRAIKNYNQLLAPLQTITSVRSGHTYQTSRFLSHPLFINMDSAVDEDKKRAKFKPIIPLGRYLSETAVEFIENQIGRPDNKTKLDKIIQDITQNSTL